MKYIVSTAVLATTCLGLTAQADEYARVVSSTPIVQQVAVPRQVCTQQQITVQPQKSGAGLVMGAIAGGTIGNAFGRGGDRALTTAIGAFGGAIFGDKIEGAPPPEVRTVQSCNTQNFYESRTVAYNIVYEYAGKQYNVQMPQDPGPTLRLQITPVVSSSQTYNYPPPPASANGVPPPGSAPQTLQ